MCLVAVNSYFELSGQLDGLFLSVNRYLFCKTVILFEIVSLLALFRLTNQVVKRFTN
jgi:hypothetical protein